MKGGDFASARTECEIASRDLVHVHDVHVLMRDEKEERKKLARSNK